MLSTVNVKPVNTKRRDRRAAEQPAAAEAAPLEGRSSQARLTLGLGVIGAVLLWAAFPPVDLPWLAWVAPVPWLWLITLPQLPGKRPYLALWVAGSVHWLLMLEGIRLAHPALYGGWIALSLYIGSYTPVFVGLARVALHRWKAPLAVAAPMIWVGLELLRGHVITGFSMGLLAHTQASIPALIQIADLAGGYTLSFLVMLVAASITLAVKAVIAWRRDRVNTPWGVMPSVLAAAVAVIVSLAYGHWRLAQSIPGQAGATVHVALLQGSLDTVFEISQERIAQTFEHYERLTDEAVRSPQALDLIVWPESMFVIPETIIEEPLGKLEGTGLSAAELRSRLAAVRADFDALLAREAARANAHTGDPGQHSTQLLVGTTTIAYGAKEPRTYNTALLADGGGRPVSRYYKTHPVMFGEYIPFAEALPWLYKLTPMSGGLTPGDGPRVFDVAGLKMSPSVCFESTIPHLVHGQLAQLRRRNEAADVLVNVTNDGWFWGTAMLDLHFRCGVFRAVENRKPLLVAANTGISAWIDGNGVVQARGAKRQAQVVYAAIQADGRDSLYSRTGDLAAWACAACCIALAITGCARRK
jgi:apolipoprotein N-acyltransferase